MRVLDKNADVSEKIRFYRKKRDIKGDALAKLIGLSRYAIIYYENNQSSPSLEDLKKIANALNIEEDKLFDDYYRFLNYPYTELINKIRNKNNLLQRELGKILGVSQRTIGRWEQGENTLSREMWEKLKNLNFL